MNNKLLYHYGIMTMICRIWYIDMSAEVGTDASI